MIGTSYLGGILHHPCAVYKLVSWFTRRGSEPSPACRLTLLTHREQYAIVLRVDPSVRSERKRRMCSSEGLVQEEVAQERTAMLDHIPATVFAVSNNVAEELC